MPKTETATKKEKPAGPRKPAGFLRNTLAEGFGGQDRDCADHNSRRLRNFARPSGVNRTALILWAIKLAVPIS
jgi:hypothetical protein